MKSTSAAQLVVANRSVPCGHTFIDPPLAADALRRRPSPLTPREVQLPQLVEQGPATESVDQAMRLLAYAAPLLSPPAEGHGGSSLVPT